MDRPPDKKVVEMNETPIPPLLTQQNFEKELQNLAIRAQQQTWAHWAFRQAWILLQAGTLYILAATYASISLLSLSPVYGGIPSALWHPKGTWISCFVGWSLNKYIGQLLPLKPRQALPLIAAYIPVMQFFLCKYSSILGVYYGPLIVEMLTFFPLLTTSVAVAASLLDGLDMRWDLLPLWISDSLPGILSFLFLKTMELFTEGEIKRTIGASFIQTRLGFQIALAGAYAVFSPSKLLLLLLPAIIHTAIFNTHVPSSYATQTLSTSLAEKGWTLLQRQESLTGYLSVLENNSKGYRVLRCDHSLLGGEWIHNSEGKDLAEPIYGVFVMLEAVRLVEVEKIVSDSDARALVIGLGIGTTPAALIKHGINTTVVEIDPVVVEFANTYFHLPQTYQAIVADAVTHIAALTLTNERYDYIVHDVFTGGAEPVQLFTVEFIQNLKTILKPEGVIAINYAGDFSLPTARIIVNTIRTVFTSCRIYRESKAPISQASSAQSDFTNMVIFCINSASKVRFRKPQEADFLNSQARRQFLPPKHEVDYTALVEQKGDNGILRQNETDRFQAWQQQSSMGHWSLMRTVLPPEIWENW